MSQGRPSGAGGYFALVAALRMFRDGVLAGDPSDRALARAAKVSPTTVGAWLAGTQFPREEGKVIAVIATVAGRAGARGVKLGGDSAGLLDEDRWREAWRTEARRRAQVVAVGVQRGQATRSLTPPSAGRPLAEMNDPFALEVHRPVQLEDAPAGLSALPTYVPREHDQVLARVVQAAAAGHSGVAVLVGGSSTGKTRACWETLDLLRNKPGWRVWHPIDPSRPSAALAELPRIGPQTVVWLNEAQFYLQVTDGGLGERVAAGLRELLRDPARAPVLVLATLWPQYWETLTVRPPSGDDDPHPQARELLTGHDIPVPTAFTAAQAGWLAGAGDMRLVLAAQLAPEGEVIQFLAGAPELLARYRNAPPAAAALINAAMDAHRLGMGIGLSHAFLEAAAPGYLADTEWDALGEDWLEQALAYAAVPCKGTRGPLTRIRPRPARSAKSDPRNHGAQPVDGMSGPLYRLADYLDQHGQAHRDGQIPPSEFWIAAAAHARAADQAELGDSAHALGLYRDAAQLHKNAAASGSLSSAFYLSNPPDYLRTDGRPRHWAAAHVSLDDPDGVARLLGVLWEAGADEQAAVLLARDPASHVTLDDPDGVAVLLGRLREAGADEQAAVLLARDPASHVTLNDPDDVAFLLDALREAGADRQAAVLASRAARVNLDHPGGVARLLDALREAGADRQAAVLASRAAAHVNLDHLGDVAFLLGRLREAGADQQATTLASRAAYMTLDHPGDVARLLGVLLEAGADQQAAALLARDPAAHVTLDNPSGVAFLLGRLRQAGADQQATALLTRDPAARVTVDHLGDVAFLLGRLREAGADQQATTLASRAAAHTPIDDPRGVARLLARLREAGANKQAAALASRAAAHVTFDHPGGVARLLDVLLEAGADEQAAALLARDPATHVTLDDPGGVARLLGVLREAGAEKQAAMLVSRAAHVTLDHPGGVARLLGVLLEAGADEQAAALLARDPATHVTLDDPGGVARLLGVLREAGADEQAAALLARDPATHVTLDDPDSVARLLSVMRKASADQQAAALTSRLPGADLFGLFLGQQADRNRFRFGREADGSPSGQWGWDDLD